jgi:hypothetical protein
MEHPGGKRKEVFLKKEVKKRSTIFMKATSWQKSILPRPFHGHHFFGCCCWLWCSFMLICGWGSRIVQRGRLVHVHRDQQMAGAREERNLVVFHPLLQVRHGAWPTPAVHTKAKKKRKKKKEKKKKKTMGTRTGAIRRKQQKEREARNDQTRSRPQHFS